ncbi:putative calpain-like cysteine peptidase [Leishmania braziliensis MHOM/BR/75/M2904]|uniref:Calpain-like cysteine peptidase n=1 Tax=Leishmania braziliensis TaxID=5660 RepID=A4HFH5_LEIBR|nr:putative calpain-like cysteine peptidase [Leishmania braziliensis MHOM/BR/75/M2904]CAM45337.2 putative calpain-like cysteine peptidase [Leishmania braziliensis MHOM/BR/75/M2904]
MGASSIDEVPDSGNMFVDHEFNKNNAGIATKWISITQLYPNGVNQPLLPEVFSREQFGQGNHYECFMISALATLVRFPDVIRNCFVTQKVRQDGRYTFQFFRGREWVRVEIDDTIPMEDGEVLYLRSPTEHWWPLLLEKAYAKFYTAYDHLEGCTLQETFHDLTGNPVLNIPMDAKLAKAANCNVLEGCYWLDLAQRIHSGEFVASVLTKDIELETMGLQREQQYGLLDIFSLQGTSALDDIVIRLHNPFEDDEFVYTGPLNQNDLAWSDKHRVKYDVNNPRSIFLPLNVFLRIVNSMQLCYISTVASDATYFEDEWKGESAGGNPTSVSWRKNPLYCFRNHGTEAVTLTVVVKQDDQRHRKGPKEETTYKQCGMILSQCTYHYPIPTFWVTANNHKPIFKSLFLNSREVANTIKIPPQSLCYLVPSCMHKGDEAKFLLAVYRMAHEDYSNITINKLTGTEMDWESPATAEVQLQMQTKDRVDFYVDEATDVHILLHQTKPYVSKSGGDAMTEDYMGMYLYDDTDRKVAGVHAATNFRETSVIHRLPRSGRYAISITCPRGKGDVPAKVTIVSSFGSQVRRVTAPEDASMLPDEAESVEENEGIRPRVTRIDYEAFQEPSADVPERPDSNVPFEDRGFMQWNGDVTMGPWVHIGDLYPEGKTVPLLPNELRRDQFGQGDHYDCSTLTAFAALLERHPDVIRNCFVSKNPRKDGRYTFQFHRYGQWVKVEIDDRIPMVKDDTVFCRSPTHHWWPLLLEKAYAKFYTLYENLAGCSLAEVFHDFSGRPVINTPLDLPTTMPAELDITSPMYWLRLRDELRTTAVGAQTGDATENLGLAPHQFYGVLDILVTSASPPRSLSEVVVQLHNPYAAYTYTGPMSDPADPRWASRGMHHISTMQNTICVPADIFLHTFFIMSQVHLLGLIEPCWNFHSEWGDGTNGGNPSLLTWRENPLYTVVNTSNEAVEIMAMIRQPDKRRQLHLLPELSYVRCDLLLAQSMENDSIPTYLVTHNNHQVVQKGIFLNYREVASKIRVPPQSQCYLVPTAMYHEKSIFLLSYWYRRPADERAVSISRLRLNVARDLPAVKHVTMVPEGKDRVDFLVDVPTVAHILLSQWNRDARSSSDVRTDNYVGMYLYDDAKQQVARVSAASNLKEIGLVAYLPAQGRYVLSITCPAARDVEVKCRVEIVCVEAARVRITDAYESAQCCEDLKGQPLVELVDSDTLVDGDRHTTEPVEVAVEKRQAVSAAQLQEKTSRASPADAEAKERALSSSFMRPQYLGIPTGDLPLMENPAFAKMAQEREQLRRHLLQNAARVNTLENTMDNMAARMADDMHKRERAFLGSQAEGIPLELLPLNEDEQFTGLEHTLRLAMKDPEKNRDDVAIWQEMLKKRVREVANEKKASERDLFLNPMHLGLPVDDLPLDIDPEFHLLEVARLRERQQEPCDEAKIRKLNDALNERAEGLAVAELAADRQHMKPEHLHVAIDELPLSENRNFVLKEALRREKMKSSCEGATAVAALEDELNDMAKDMAAELLAKQRPSYLAPEHNGRRIADLPLNTSNDFLAKERRRRDLLKQPNPDMNKVIEIEEELGHMASSMAIAMNAAERPQYMKDSYHTKNLGELPLNADTTITTLEAQRARLKYDPLRNAAAIRATEELINSRAAALAKSMMHEERVRLYGKPNGVPVNLLDLHEDSLIRHLEEERMNLLSNPATNPHVINTIEEKLKARAAEIADNFRANMRAEITGEQCRSPSLMSVGSDAPCQDMEEKLYTLLSEDPISNEEQIMDLKEAIRKRHGELKRQAVHALRSFLEEAPFGILLAEVGLDEDPEYMEKEADLQKSLANNSSATQIKAIRDSMQQRVYELAAEKLVRRYPFLSKRPAGIPLAELPILSRDQPFLQAITDLEKTEADEQKTEAQLRAQQEALNQRLHAVAEEQKWKEREMFLVATTAAVPLRLLPLDNDIDFVHLEQKRRSSLRSGNALDIRTIENTLNERAHVLASEKKWADRGKVLDPKPEGVPLSHVPLDEDAEFVALEDEWRGLAQDPRRNERALADLEKAMNDRAHVLASETKWADRGKVLDPKPEGVPLSHVPLDEDAEFVALEDEWRGLAQDPRRNERALADLEKAMNDRAHVLASEKKWADRGKVLDPKPEGVPLSHVPLDEDAEFVALEDEWRGLAQDPRRNERALADLEKAMNDRAHVLASETKWADRGKVLDPKPEGVPLSHVPLDEDAEFVALEDEWRGLAQDPRRNERALADLEKAMNDRAHVLASETKWADRGKVLDPKPEGVPLSHVPLDEDAEFVALEDEWRGLAQDPRRNERALADLEKAMNDRAHVLASETKWADRGKVLDPKPEGVPLSHVPLDEDAEFVALEDEWRGLAQDPRRNERALADLEKAMNDRAHVLASEKKWADRGKVLDPKPEGVPLSHVPLDEDAEFVALEDEWRGLAQDPRRNERALADLEKAMNDRAHVLASEKKWADRGKVLDPKPEGVPLSHVPLDEDAEFVALEDEWRGLAQDPRRNERALADLEKAMNDRAHVLASETKWADRGKVLDPKPEGVPLSHVPLDEDAEFVALEDEWRGLAQDPRRNERALADLEKAMNDRAHVLASETKWADRGKVLDPKPEGVPLSHVPLDEDAEFVALEDEWRGLAQDPRRNERALADLEKAMNDRAHVLASETKWADRGKVLDPKPEGVPLSHVPLDEDAEFVALEDEWRGLAQDPRRNERALADLEKAMNDRAHVLASETKWADRGKVLDPKPEGVPLSHVPLDEDAEFVALEDEWRGLAQDPRRNERALADLEKAMNDRAHVLASETKWADRGKVLDPKPEGVPLSHVPLDEDAEFVALEDEWRGLAQDPRRNERALADLEKAMNDRAHVLASETKWADRGKVLDPKPEGVPLSHVPLDEDAEFVALEDEWRGLAQDPRRNERALADLEKAMNDRAHVLASETKWADRGKVLDPKPEGVPLSHVPLDEDAEFVALEDEWRGLAQDPRRNERALADLEKAMNDRAHVLASETKWADRGKVLDPKPEGVPLSHVPLDEDAEFVALEDEWRGLAQDPRRNERALADLEKAMNDRAHVLASETKWADRGKVLDPKPEGVPLSHVPLDEDAEFVALEDEWRGLAQDPRRNERALADLEKAMNDRAHVLASETKWADRGKVLDPKPEGVPLSHVPLDEDAEFVALEDEWRGLAQDPRRNERALADLEKAMNDRAHVLASETKWADRGKVLDPKPEGVPLSHVPLDEDAEFVALEDEWRGLAQDPRRNERALADLEKAMNDRAHVLASETKWADRGKVLDPKPEGVPLSHVPLDEDAEFVALEDEWRGLAQDPRRNERALADLEKAMNDRAHVLASETKWADRGKVLDPKPEGVPLSHVPLDEDAEFVALEDEWRGLAQDPRRNERALADLEKAMNDRAHVLASEKKWADRGKVLDPKPEGVPLSHVPLDEDAEFVALEDEWRGLAQDPRRNERALADLEKAMNDRAHVLASETKWADRGKVLDPKPEGVPLSHVPLDEDAEFVALEDEWRGLAQDPRRNERALADLEKAMNDRAHVLASETKWADRGKVLDPKPEGVPLSHVPLDEDAEFVALEDEWRGLAQDPRRNERALADLEKAMNDRAHVLASETKWADRGKVLDPKPEGVPLSHVPLDEDAEFVALEDEWRGLAQDPRRNERALADLEKAMNDRAHVLASETKWADRGKVLDPKPEGVPLSHVPLDEDAEFVALEDEWRGLAQDPRRNERALADLEKAMNDRAHVLASETKWADRGKVLDPKPEGVPLSHVPLDEDAEFVALEDEWRGLAQDPRRNERALADLEKAMNDRAHVLASETKWADRGKVLDPKPEGVPLSHVPLDEDAEFVALEDEWRGLAQDPRRNERALADLEKAMNDRAHVLASETKWADRGKVLDPKPEGVPLSHVPLDEDAEFVALEDEWRGLAQDPRRNAKEMAAIEEEMMNRVYFLARGLAYCQDCLEKKDECSCGSGGMGIRKDVGSCEEVDGVGALNVMMGRRTTERGFDGLLGSVVDGVPTVLLKLSDDDVFCKQNDEYLDVLKADSELKRIRQLEGEMLDRAHVLARRFKDEIRSAVVGEKMALLAEGGAELDRDETFVALERELFNLEASDDRGGGCRRAALVDSLRQRASELAEIPLHGVCRGISAETVSEVSQKELFDNQPGGRRQNTTPKKNGRYVSTVMGRSTWNVADEIEAGESYLFLGKEVYGIPLDKIPYRDDEVFRGLSEERRRVMNHPEDYSAGYQEEVEDALRRRVEELADEYKRDHIKHTTASDGQPKKPRKPNGAPGESCSPPRRPQGKKKLREVEERTEEHRRETVELASAFTDPPFHDANSQAEDAWPRIADVYPEGLMQPLLPNYPKTSDMASPAGDLTYLAPFLAALSRQPPLLHRLFQVKAHPVRAPYTFVFFDPNGTPVTVGIDDRIPCDANGVPRFTVSPNGAWWPLLVEKAYAKYVGGYDRFDECTSHETLRDLTGRPVTHLPLDAKLSAEVSGCNYRDVTFWRRIHEQLERGDVFMAVSSDMTPDGIHRHCHYAVFDVIETVPGSNDPSDVVVKIHNCYRDAPEYHGPLAKGDSDWTPKLRSVCKADPESEPEFLYVPQPVFLRNFSSMQRCHVNCGDRLTVSGEWTGACSGGNPTYTTFRRNPMYLVQNNSNRNVTVLAELRHSAPVYYDAHNLGVYHLTALALLRPDSNAQLVAPLLAYNTHKFLQKGLLTDAREVCVEMELPANSTCYLIPYTKKKACFGKYQLSVYPQDNPVNLTTLRPIDETHSCLTKDVLVQPGTGTSVRVDLVVSSPCDVHALLHQNKVTDPKSIKRGDHLAEDEIFMAVYENNTALVCSTGDASNAREHAIAFQATKPGRYTFLVGCPSRPVSGDAPCTLIIYTPTYAQARFASLNEPIRPNVPPRVQSSKATTSSASARLGAWQPQVPQRSASTSSIAAQTPRGNPRNRRYL